MSIAEGIASPFQISALDQSSSEQSKCAAAAKRADQWLSARENENFWNATCALLLDCVVDLELGQMPCATR